MFSRYHIGETMPRPINTTRRIHPVLSSEIADAVNHYHADILNKVIQHVAQDKIVVVGMAWNPSVRKANALLTAKGYAYTYLEFGSYLSHWRERLSIKMWTGWPTFPQVFVNGILIGGYDDLNALFNKKELQPLLESERYE